MSKILTPVRQIHTTYYFRKDVVKVNSAKYANNAVLSCVDHMQHNHYGASLAEVYDAHSGVLHAVVKRDMGSSTIHILFKRDVKEEY